MSKARNKEEKPRTELGTFASKGIGASKKTVISVGYSQEVYDLLRSLPNTSKYVRDAVEARMREDGIHPEDPEQTTPDEL